MTNDDQLSVNIHTHSMVNQKNISAVSTNLQWNLCHVQYEIKYISTLNLLNVVVCLDSLDDNFWGTPSPNGTRHCRISTRLWQLSASAIITSYIQFGLQKGIIASFVPVAWRHNWVCQLQCLELTPQSSQEW